MKIYLIRTEPVQELAAEPGTLALLRTVLRPYAAPSPTEEDELHRPSSLGLPLVADSTVAPGVAHYRPICKTGTTEDEVSAALVAQEALRVQVHAALKAAGVTQATAAERLKVSKKHMNQMLTGRAELPLHWAARILRLCDRHLVIGSGPGAPEQQLEQS